MWNDVRNEPLGAAGAARSHARADTRDAEYLQEFTSLQAHQLTRSVMTDEAVGAHLARAVAVDAPPHLQRVRPHHAIAGARASSVPDFHFRHRFDRPVTLLAREAGADVTHVREMSVVRNPVDAHPWDRPLLAPVRDQLLHFGAVCGDQRHTTRNVTARTHLHGRNAGIDRAVGCGMAVHAGDLIGTGMDVMGESNRLGGSGTTEGTHGKS